MLLCDNVWLSDYLELTILYPRKVPSSPNSDGLSDTILLSICGGISIGGGVTKADPVAESTVQNAGIAFSLFLLWASRVRPSLLSRFLSRPPLVPDYACLGQ